jgi:hypothetical protein
MKKLTSSQRESMDSRPVKMYFVMVMDCSISSREMLLISQSERQNKENADENHEVV